MSRIAARFGELKKQNRAAFIAFISAGDPDYATSLEIFKGLPAAGADIIELGMPFTDPMAEGPAIQASSLRALQAGQTMAKTLQMVREFRKQDTDTPVVLMGYYNPVYAYGVENFATEARAAGVDGLIIVDLPPEEDTELRGPATRPASTSYAWPPRRRTKRACRWCSMAPRASSITFRSWGSPAPRPSQRKKSARLSPGSSSRRIYQLRWASG